MRAVRFRGVGEPLLVEDVPSPLPGRGEVLVDVAACGVCASDVHMIDGSLPTGAQVPITPGHEASGVVAACGPEVDGWKAGDRVAIYIVRRCGRCARCLIGGSVDDCLDVSIMGNAWDGAWAEQVVVPQECLVALPDAVPLEVAALLGDAVATPFNAVVDVGDLRPGERVAVFGVGGLGTHGLMLARLAGASFVVAVDPSPVVRERALRLGADAVVDPAAGRASEQVRELTEGQGVDLALDFAGGNAVLREAVASLAVGGRAVVIGVSRDRVELGPSAVFAVRKLQLRSVLGYQKRHLEALVRLVAAGRLDLGGSISGRFALEEVGEAVTTLAERRGEPVRLLLTP